MIERNEVEAVQESWGKSLVHVGAGESWEESRDRAEEMIKSHYLLEDNEALLFCPTKASVKQFRGNFKSALSYFVGRDNEFDEDKGFALEPWKSVRFENTDVVCKQDLAFAMGNYYFTTLDDNEVKVEYSFVYIRDNEGKLKIQLHHSAIPYSH